MATGQYVGIAGKCRRVITQYVGIAGKARKVTKVYVGRSGVARLAWEEEEETPPSGENYTVTYDLTGATSTNTAATVKKNEAFTSNIMAKAGYKLAIIDVKMAGRNITSSCCTKKFIISGGTLEEYQAISITKVTGNVVIWAVAKKTSDSSTV